MDDRKDYEKQRVLVLRFFMDLFENDKFNAGKEEKEELTKKLVDLLEDLIKEVAATHEAKSLYKVNLMYKERLEGFYNEIRDEVTQFEIKNFNDIYSSEKIKEKYKNLLELDKKI